MVEKVQKVKAELDSVLAIARDFPSMRPDVEAYLTIVANMTRVFTRAFVERERNNLYPHLGVSNEERACLYP